MDTLTGYYIFITASFDMCNANRSCTHDSKVGKITKNGFVTHRFAQLLAEFACDARFLLFRSSKNHHTKNKKQKKSKKKKICYAPLRTLLSRICAKKIYVRVSCFGNIENLP